MRSKKRAQEEKETKREVEEFLLEREDSMKLWACIDPHGWFSIVKCAVSPHLPRYKETVEVEETEDVSTIPLARIVGRVGNVWYVRKV
jgi:hypothetical protein